MNESKEIAEKNDKYAKFAKELQKVLTGYFCLNIPSERELAVVKRYIPDFKMPEDNLLAKTSRLFSSHGQSGRKRALKLLRELSDCDHYLDLLDTIYRFSLDGKDKDIPQGDLKKYLINLLIKELGIAKESYQNEANYSSPLPTLVSLPHGGLVTVPNIQESFENRLWRRKLAALQTAMEELQPMRDELLLAKGARNVLLAQTQLPTTIIEEVTDYLKPTL